MIGTAGKGGGPRTAGELPNSDSRTTRDSANSLRIAALATTLDRDGCADLVGTPVQSLARARRAENMATRLCRSFGLAEVPPSQEYRASATRAEQLSVQWSLGRLLTAQGASTR